MMVSKQTAYSVVLKHEFMEVAKKILKEVAAKQLNMCMTVTDDDELSKILENTILDEFKLPVIGSP